MTTIGEFRDATEGATDGADALQKLLTSTFGILHGSPSFDAAKTLCDFMSGYLQQRGGAIELGLTRVQQGGKTSFLFKTSRNRAGAAVLEIIKLFTDNPERRTNVGFGFNEVFDDAALDGDPSALVLWISVSYHSLVVGGRPVWDADAN